MMKCKKCGKKAEVFIDPLPPLCKDCFCKIIEKRIRKEARLQEWFDKDDKIYTDSKISKFVVNSIIPDLPKEFVEEREKAEKVVLAKTCDDIVVEELGHIFENEELKRNEEGQINILSTMTDREAELLATINNFEFKPNKKDERILAFINKLQSKYPETKTSLVKSLNELKEI